MNFKEAWDKLSRAAPGQYRSATYKLTENQFGGKEQECSLYVDGFSHATAESWGGAFEKLAAMLNNRNVGDDIVIDDVDELP